MGPAAREERQGDVPCHHNLDHFLDEYIDAAGIVGDLNGYLFRTAAGKPGILTATDTFAR